MISPDGPGGRSPYTVKELRERLAGLPDDMRTNIKSVRTEQMPRWQAAGAVPDVLPTFAILE